MKVSIFGFLILIAIACDSDEVTQEQANDPGANEVATVPATPLPASMKGYELYSWEKQGEWNYTLITGTNRNKTFAEISAPENIEDGSWVKITVLNIPDLKKVLARVPQGQHVMWVSSPYRISGCGLPSASTLEDVKKQCEALGLIFHA